MDILCFKIQDQRFAIPVAQVDRVIMAQAITLIPDSPGILLGMIDYFGEIIAVINLRFRFNLNEQSIRLTDRFVIAEMPGRRFALPVDEIEGVLDLPDEHANQILETSFGLKITSVLRDEKGIILIYDIDKLINNTEEIEINAIVRSAKTIVSGN